MAQKRLITPEKQLLKLIEGHAAHAAGVHGKAIKHHGLSLLSPDAWQGRVSFFREAFKNWFVGIKPHQLDVKLVNKLLLFFIIIMGFYFVLDIFGGIVSLKKMPDLKFKQQAGVAAGVEKPSLLKSTASYYLEKISLRNIFKIGAVKSGDDAQAAPKAPSSKIMEATQNMRLVGISWSNNPDAMIENTKLLKTVFVKRGQMVDGVTVHAIFKDRVVLRFAGEEIELK